MQSLKKSTTLVPNSHKLISVRWRFWEYSLTSLVVSAALLSGCVALPLPPTTPLCIFVNTYADKADPDVVKNPKLLGQLMPAEKYYFRCINQKHTKYNIYVTSPSASNMIATPYKDYLEMNAYLNKLADVFQKEVLSKIGK